MIDINFYYYSSKTTWNNKLKKYKLNYYIKIMAPDYIEHNESAGT